MQCPGVCVTTYALLHSPIGASATLPACLISLQTTTKQPSCWSVRLVSLLLFLLSLVAHGVHHSLFELGEVLFSPSAPPSLPGRPPARSIETWFRQSQKNSHGSATSGCLLDGHIGSPDVGIHCHLLRRYDWALQAEVSNHVTRYDWIPKVQ